MTTVAGLVGSLPAVQDRWTLGSIQNPIRGFLHAGAALAAVAGVFLLLARSPGGVRGRLALAVFGVSLVVVYTVSVLYHTIRWGPEWKHRMLRFDNSAIFLGVAASYTPWLVIVFDGWLTWVPLLVVWGVAAAGIIQLAAFPGETTGGSIAAAVALGWMAVLLLVPMASRVPWTAIAFVVLGGVLYTVGAAAVLTRRPRLWPRVFSYHEVFHLLAIGGSAAHFFATWRWVAPLPAG